jgi:hypothetical protein
LVTFFFFRGYEGDHPFNEQSFGGHCFRCFHQ